MKKYTKIILTSGIEIVGEYNHKLSNDTSVAILTNYPYVIKEYIDRESIFTGVMNTNGAEKCTYRSDAFVLRQKKEKTLATIPRVCIKEQI